MRFLILCVLFLRRSVLPLVTCSFSVFFYNLRAVFTQYGFTGILGRCVLFYLINRMGHA